MLSLALGTHDESLGTEPLLAALSAPERDHHANLRRDKRGREFLLSRWLVRQHLGFELNAEPRELDIIYPAGQHPVCTATPRRISLSHSGPVCLSLLGTPSPGGCDIEWIRERRFPPESLAASYFDAAETRALRAVPPAQRLADFYRLWTLKEAGLKALGRGLSAGLSGPAFALLPRLQCWRAPGPGPWFFGALDLALPAGHVALAVAARGGVETIDLARFEATGSGTRRTPLTDAWHTTAID